MAINESTAAQRTLEALGLTEEAMPLPRVVALIPLALARLVTLARTDPEVREALRREFSLTAAAGRAELTDAITAGLAVDELRTAQLYLPSGLGPAEWEPDRETLGLMAEVGHFGFAREGSALYFSDPVTGAVGTLSGEVTMRALATPTITAGTINIAPRLAPVLVGELSALVVASKEVTA
jgi:hypothetical protein